MATKPIDMTVFVVSDGTGDTGSAAVRAAMIQFRDRWRLRVFRDARTISEVRRVIELAEEVGALNAWPPSLGTKSTNSVFLKRFTK